MHRYLIIESHQSLNILWTELLAFFADFIKINRYETSEKKLIIYYDAFEPIDFEALIYSMIAETYNHLRLYQSQSFEDLDSLKAHVSYMEKQLDLVAFNSYTYINDHQFLKHHLEHHLPVEKKYILKKYANRSDIHHTIKTFLECNQNINQAAKELYIHRNTLLQRLDKFYQATGFDVKKFQDAFLIYQLL
ncbi:MAG: helix-turn-helix domain-containing protein [Acholeplasmataceae bacterium]